MSKIGSVIKEKWRSASIWLLGTIIVIVLTKTCDVIWPNNPVVIKEYTDTVTVLHTIPSIEDAEDSVFRKRLEQQLRDIELLDKYEKRITNRKEDGCLEPCTIVVGNPYSRSRGYTKKKSSPFCYVEIRDNPPFLDIEYSFIREDYMDMVNTLGVKVYGENKTGGLYIILDQNYEPQDGMKNLLVRIANDIPAGSFSIDVGFILKEDAQKEYPVFYCQTFTYKK